MSKTSYFVNELIGECDKRRIFEQQKKKKTFFFRVGGKNVKRKDIFWPRKHKFKHKNIQIYIS